MTTWYQSSGSKPWGGIAIVVGVIVAVLGGINGSWPAIFGGLLFALLAYASIWRPAVGASDTTMRLRGMYSATVIPLAAVDSIVITRTFAVSVLGQRYVSSALGRSLRQSVHGRNAPRGLGGLVPGLGPKGPTPPSYVDLVEEQLARLVHDARFAARAPQGSEAQGALAEQIRRVWAWPEIAVSAVVAVALVVSFFV